MSVMKETIDLLRNFLEAEKNWGVEEFFSPSLRKNIDSFSMSKIQISKEKQLGFLFQKVKMCQKCSIFKHKKNYVFGEGNSKADLLFIGEAPGREEDLQGKPFVGRAGQLLTKIIQAIGLKRNDVYIANILKCRPPENRNPLPQEIENCSPYLKEQIKIIQPKIICTLGKFASQTLLNSTVAISKLRGKFYDYQRTKLIPTFHPAYLLRNPQEKILVWEDMKKIKAELSKI